jgi:hypothetical protein
VGSVHRAAERRLLLVAAFGGHGEIRERRARTLDRMPVHPTALHPAFHHAVADAWASELHDHVRRPGQQSHPHQTVVNADGGTRRPRRGCRGIAYRTFDVLKGLTDRHRPTYRQM